ncbi:class I SAM-dependent methyltransferase [Chitinophaga nivalis]|uniref:Methyltransferase domain-containing protein n=1 Tax=Chitinophaga nivalis TaxID=2991709 RepID=A0ABT3ILS1_9BACT|nr:methyltransferase domain-containing protein [Chitinophaga nivalis]MCW3465420.1 methyltransferase domain-containing protein [Chitinophaga nivalis]MCW3484888.1 methyltransferase domain-containing protein [Chitinophaga nivalis]
MANITYEYDRMADRKRLDFITDALHNTIPENGTILDVGCGNGIISRHLGQLGYNVLGIDVSEKAIGVARSLTSRPNVRFEAISAEKLVAAGNTYDAVICSEVLEHLDQPSLLLKVLYQSLKPTGRLVVTVPNGNGPREALVTKPVLRMRNNNTWRWRALLRIKKILGYKGTTVQSAADNLDHVQFFTKNDLEQLSAAHNFRIVKYGKANFLADVFPFSLVANRVKFLQQLDCKLADALPLQCTTGFFTIWVKER